MAQTEYRHQYGWYVVYDGGEKAHEYDLDGRWHLISEIARDRVIIFGMEDAQHKNRHWVDLKTGVFTINNVEIEAQEMPEGPYDFIWFKRIIRHFSPTEPNEQIKFIIGIRKTESGANRQWLAFIDGNDTKQVTFTNEK